MEQGSVTKKRLFNGEIDSWALLTAKNGPFESKFTATAVAT